MKAVEFGFTLVNFGIHCLENKLHLGVGGSTLKVSCFKSNVLFFNQAAAHTNFLGSG